MFGACVFRNNNSKELGSGFREQFLHGRQTLSFGTEIMEIARSAQIRSTFFNYNYNVLKR
jgi:hypothetical protein